MNLPDVRFIRRELEEYQQLLSIMPQDGEWKTAAWRKKLHRHATILADSLWEVTKFIATIPDSELRLIFELRYFRGLTWEQVAAEMPPRLSPNGARMKHDRYLSLSNKKVGSQGLSSLQSS